MSFTININPGNFYPGWGKRIADIYDVWKNDAPDTVERLFKNSIRINDSIVEDIRFNNWGSMDYDYLRVSKEIQKEYYRMNNKPDKRVGTISTLLARLESIKYLIVPYSKRELLSKVKDTCDILENGAQDSHDESIQRRTMMYLYGVHVKKWFKLCDLFPKTRLIHILCGWRLKKLLPLYDATLCFHFSRFMYRTHYLFPSRFRNLIHALVGDIEPDRKTGFYGDIQHEWDICMETPDFFDARETIKNRIEHLLSLHFSKCN